ncbi:MAG: hypothetical protein ABIS51_12670, partial [Sphingomonas sp.]
ANVYAEAAVRPMHLMSLLSANVRVYAIFVACLLGNPKLFWWFEIVLLTTILIIGFVWHRSVETKVLRLFSTPDSPSFSSETASTKDVTKQ